MFLNNYKKNNIDSHRKLRQEGKRLKVQCHGTVVIFYMRLVKSYT